jgi:hypothetical protein
MPALRLKPDALPPDASDVPMRDLDALAAELSAGLEDARACLVLSGDGLVLAAHPRGSEDAAREPWLRMAQVGNVERGFLRFDAETWVYVRSGEYAAFMITGTAVRAGIVLDHLEHGLRRASSERDGEPNPIREREHPRPVPVTEPGPLRAPDDAPTPGEAPHRAGPIVLQPETDPGVLLVGSDAYDGDPGPGERPTPSDAVDAARARGGDEAAPAHDRSEDAAAEDGLASQPVPALDDVDRLSLTREFAQLLQDDGRPADG